MGNLRIFGASVEGLSHLAESTVCQDAYYFTIIDPDIAIIAVADGLGSVNHSDIGAKLSTEFSVNYVKDHIEQLGEAGNQNEDYFRSFLTEMVEKTRTHLNDHSRTNEFELSELACTLIVLVITGTTISVSHIGDGAVIVRKDENFLVLSEPEPSEYANEVYPITLDDWEHHLRIHYLEGIDAAAVFTDGCQGALLSKAHSIWSAYDDAFEYLFAWAESQTDDVIARENIALFLKEKMSQYTDDKTLVVAVRRGLQ